MISAAKTSQIIIMAILALCSLGLIRFMLRLIFYNDTKFINHDIYLFRKTITQLCRSTLKQNSNFAADLE